MSSMIKTKSNKSVLANQRQRWKGKSFLSGEISIASVINHAEEIRTGSAASQQSVDFDRSKEHLSKNEIAVSKRWFNDEWSSDDSIRGLNSTYASDLKDKASKHFLDAIDSAVRNAFQKIYSKQITDVNSFVAFVKGEIGDFSSDVYNKAFENSIEYAKDQVEAPEESVASDKGKPPSHRKHVKRGGLGGVISMLGTGALYGLAGSNTTLISGVARTALGVKALTRAYSGGGRSSSSSFSPSSGGGLRRATSSFVSRTKSSLGVGGAELTPGGQREEEIENKNGVMTILKKIEENTRMMLGKFGGKDKDGSGFNFSSLISSFGDVAKKLLGIGALVTAINYLVDTLKIDIFPKLSSISFGFTEWLKKMGITGEAPKTPPRSSGSLPEAPETRPGTAPEFVVKQTPEMYDKALTNANKAVNEAEERLKTAEQNRSAVEKTKTKNKKEDRAKKQKLLKANTEVSSLKSSYMEKLADRDKLLLEQKSFNISRGATTSNPSKKMPDTLKKIFDLFGKLKQSGIKSEDDFNKKLKDVIETEKSSGSGLKLGLNVAMLSTAVLAALGAAYRDWVYLDDKHEAKLISQEEYDNGLKKLVLTHSLIFASAALIILVVEKMLIKYAGAAVAGPLMTGTMVGLTAWTLLHEWDDWSDYLNYEEAKKDVKSSSDGRASDLAVHYANMGSYNTSNITKPEAVGHILHGAREANLTPQQTQMLFDLVGAESIGGNNKAISDTGAVGYGQITEVALAEVNNILKLRTTKEDLKRDPLLSARYAAEYLKYTDREIDQESSVETLRSKFKDNEKYNTEANKITPNGILWAGYMLGAGSVRSLMRAVESGSNTIPSSVRNGPLSSQADSIREAESITDLLSRITRTLKESPHIIMQPSINSVPTPQNPDLLNKGISPVSISPLSEMLLRTIIGPTLTQFG